MKYLLTKANRLILARHLAAEVALVFDFDGTLAPIVSARKSAEMRPRTRRWFERVCELYPCAVISGRSRKDVIERMANAPVKYTVGNHGLEPGENLARFERVVRVVTPKLARAFAAQPGVQIEDKKYSLAVHYRESRHKRKALDAIESAVRALGEPMRIIGGKLVVNVVPAGAPHKGDAVLALIEKERADMALYVGDDITDEDVFALNQPSRLVSVRVGNTRNSAAQYYLRDQPEIERLLAVLYKLRATRAQPTAATSNRRRARR